MLREVGKADLGIQLGGDKKVGLVCLRCVIMVRRKLHSVIRNWDINLPARCLLLLSVVIPSLEHAIELWDCNQSQTRALESILLGGAMMVLGCSSKMCNEAVRL